MSFTQPRYIPPSLIYGYAEEEDYEEKWKPDKEGKETTHFIIKKTGFKNEYPFCGNHTRVDIQLGGNSHISPRDYGDKERVEHLNHHYLEILNIYAIIGWDMEISNKFFQMNCPVHCHFLTDKQTTAVKKYLTIINDEKVWGGKSNAIPNTPNTGNSGEVKSTKKKKFFGDL